MSSTGDTRDRSERSHTLLSLLLRKLTALPDHRCVTKKARGKKLSKLEAKRSCKLARGVSPGYSRYIQLLIPFHFFVLRPLRHVTPRLS